MITTRINRSDPKWNRLGIIGCSLLLILLSSLISADLQPERIAERTERGEECSIVSEPKLSEITFSYLKQNLSDSYKVSIERSDSDARPQFGIDSQNNLHFVWEQNGTNREILYRMFDWETQTYSEIIPISDGDNNMRVTLAIDSQDTIHVAWEQGNYARYRARVEGVWGSQVSFFDADRPEISINGNDDVLILYRRIPQNYLRARFRNSSSTTWEQIDITTNTAVSRMSATADESGSFHIVYIEEGDLKYATNQTSIEDGANWDTVDISDDLGLGTVSDPVILVDSAEEIVHTAWGEFIDGSHRVRVANKTFEDSNFNQLAYETHHSQGEERVDLALDQASNLIVLWERREAPRSIEYVPNTTIPSNEAITIEEQSRGGKVRIDSRQNLYFTYALRTEHQVRYRMLDVVGPELDFISPTNHTQVSGALNLNVSVAPDTQQIVYSYHENPSGDGIPEDDNWVEIATITDPMDGNFNYTWIMDELDYKNIIVMANATDKRNLDEAIMRAFITIDNHPPQEVEFINVIDEYGINASEEGYGRGNITVTFEASDNCTGIDYVELWDGTTYLARNHSWDDPNTLTWVSEDFPEGLYSELFLRAYDRAGNFKDSEYFDPVYIDNDGPIMEDVDEIANRKFPGRFRVNITAEDDTESITVSYGNATLDYQLLGEMDHISGDLWRSPIWETKILGLHGEYTLLFEAVDEFGNEANFTINIIVDNVPPLVQIVSPTATSTGYNLNLKAYALEDTVEVGVYYSDEYFSQSAILSNKDEPDDYATIIPLNDTHVEIRYNFDASIYREDDVNIPFFILLEAMDDVGNTDHAHRQYTLINQAPSSTRILRGSHRINTQTNLNNITLTIFENLQPNDAEILIYRSLTPFNITQLNQMSPVQRLNYLGHQPGENYCVGSLDLDDLSTRQGTNERIFNDTNVPANTYYYTVIVINIYGNPSEIDDFWSISFVPIDPARQINTDRFEAMPYVIGGIALALGIFAVTSVRATKKVRKDRKIKKKAREIALKSPDELLELDGLKSLDKESKKDLDIEDFLTMEVEKDVPEEVVEGSSAGIKKCESCGWILSAGSRKCPRCGKAVF